MSALFGGTSGYSYDGTAFYSNPSARLPRADRPFEQQAAYAIARVFADLDSPDPATQAGALLQVSAVGVAVAVPVALALPESVVAAAGSTIIGGATTIATGAVALLQKAQSFLPWVGKQAADARAAFQAAYSYATQANKLDHIFRAEHNLESLVAKFGSREAVVRDMLDSIKGQTPASGVFEITTNISGQTVVVRGAVVDGVTRIGTAFAR